MARLPYMNFPFPFYKSHPRYLSNFPSYSQHIMNAAPGTINTTVSSNTQSAMNSFSSNNIISYTGEEDCRDFKSKNKSNKYANDYLFDLFGLKIYNDDILLVSLIYFLYSEGVKDDSLFIVLILLLLS